MGPFMQRLITEDPQRFKAYYKYEHFLVSLLDKMGWDAAEAYHWLLFERIEDGEFDLVTDGPYDARSMRTIDQKFLHLRCQGKCKRATTQTNRLREPQRSGSTRRSDWTEAKPNNCKYHGNVAHLTAACSVDPSNGGSGVKSPNFRA
jgi:hypothetical protein